MENRLVYGKNSLERIVSLEIKDSSVEIFQQQPDGSIKSILVPHKYWIISNKWHNRTAKVLEGNLYFKYMSFFDERKDWETFKYTMKHRMDLYSIYNEKESFMVTSGHTYCKGLKPSEIGVLSFDIETNGLKRNAQSRVFLISNTYRLGTKVIKKLFCYDEYNSDGEMIEDWCKWVCECDPSFLVGHNINGYDLPYLHHVAGLTGHGMPLGRDKSNISFSTFESKFRLDGTRDLKYNKVAIYGREVIDTMFLAYKYDIGKKYENYKLKNIIKQEGLEKADRTYYDAGKIKDNYKIPEEWEKIKAYCVDDSDEALALYDLMIPPYFYMGQSVPKSMQAMIESATGGQISSILVRGYLQDGHSIPKASEIQQIGGGLSFGVPGIYRNIYKQDIASLYPSIIRQYKLYDKDKDPKGYFLKLCDTLTLERLKNKKLAKETGQEYYKHLEQSQKQTINSIYGMCNTAGIPFNSPKIGDFITAKGREILGKAIFWATGKETQYWLDLFEEKTK